MKTIYFVRHGQSEGNITPVFQATDSPLTKKGKEQAKFIAERASHLSIEIVVASPLARANETAKIIIEKIGKPLEFSELFVERVKPKGIASMTYGDPKAEKLYTKWEKDVFTSGSRTTDAENYDDLVDRAQKALSYLSKRSEKEILVVTHGFFLRVVMAYVLFGNALTGKNLKYFQKQIKTENTGLTILEYDEDKENSSWCLLVWNDHAHLG